VSDEGRGAFDAVDASSGVSEAQPHSTVTRIADVVEIIDTVDVVETVAPDGTHERAIVAVEHTEIETIDIETIDIETVDVETIDIDEVDRTLGELGPGSSLESGRDVDEARVPTQGALPLDMRTGDAGVDAAVAQLAALDDRPVAEHAEVFTAVHRALQDALVDLDRS
jgi:hypothetical protein